MYFKTERTGCFKTYKLTVSTNGQGVHDRQTDTVDRRQTGMVFKTDGRKGYFQDRQMEQGV